MISVERLLKFSGRALSIVVSNEIEASKTETRASVGIRPTGVLSGHLLRPPRAVGVEGNRMADSPGPQETYKEQMERLRWKAEAPHRRRTGVYVAVVFALVFVGWVMI